MVFLVVYDPEGNIKDWLDYIEISSESKECLINDALVILDEIQKNSSGRKSEQEIRAALMLSCEQNSCAVGNNIPKASLKYLSKARKITGIQYNEPIERIDAMARILGVDGNIKTYAKNLLLKYKEKDINGYLRRTSLGTAASAIYIASIVFEEPLSQKIFYDKLGISTIHPIYREICDAVDVELGNF